MFFDQITGIISFGTCLFILLGSIIISIKTGFIQFRAIPKMIKIILQRKKRKSCDNTISVKKALLTAMSSSIGIGNIVSPIIAIKLGGPGALIGFLLATIFGSAATFAEVTFALKNRTRNKDGSVNGGAMPFIKKALSAKWAKAYAMSALVVVTIWASNQANALADLLQAHNVPNYVTGILLAGSITYILMGGVKRVGEISAKLVPAMLILYISAISWILFKNFGSIGSTIALVFKSAFSYKAMFGAGAGYGLHSALRWGLAKGYYSNVSGLGTASIPHSMSATNSPINQGIVSMTAVYTNGIICFLTGLAVLLPQNAVAASNGIGINVIAQIFTNYFSSVGIVIVAFSGFLFALGTIIGEGFMGSHCFTYSFDKKHLKYYNLGMALLVFLGAMSDVKFLAQITDIFLLPLAIPNMLSLVLLSFKESDVLHPDLSGKEQFMPAEKIPTPEISIPVLPVEIPAEVSSRIEKNV